MNLKLVKKNKYLFICITTVFFILCSLSIFASLYSTYISYSDFIFLHPVKSMVVVDPSKIPGVLRDTYECGASFICTVPSFSFLVLLFILETYNGVLFWYFRKKLQVTVLFGIMIALHVILIVPPIGSVFIPQILVHRIVVSTDRDIEEKIQSAVLRKPGFFIGTNDVETELTKNSQSDIRIIEDNPSLGFILSMYGVDLAKIQGSFFQMVVVPSVSIRHKDEVERFSSPVILDKGKGYLYIFDLGGVSRVRSFLQLLSSRIVRQTFSQYIKKLGEPVVEILGEKEYVAVQKKRFSDILTGYQSHIQNLTRELAGINRDLANMKSLKGELSSERASYESTSHAWYAECISKRSVDHDTCKNGKKTMDESLRSYDTDQGTVEKNISTLTDARPQFEKEIALEESLYQDVASDPVTPELQDGIYYSPATIYIRSHSETTPFHEYLATALHEYLHFASDTGETLPAFLEEGMTEYLNNILLSSVLLRVTPNSLKRAKESYAKEVGIVKRLGEKMTDEKVVSMYFSKNVDPLAVSLGKESYQKFLSLGDRLYYLPLQNEFERANIFEQMQAVLKE
ncbi:hypothetical protein HY947_00720 [Candidatus Gottesmanbacteria bacterium]|nr:hypothetical protein [Candidatus Gottesmanbacteria bacterium]